MIFGNDKKKKPVTILLSNRKRSYLKRIRGYKKNKKKKWHNSVTTQRRREVKVGTLAR